MHLFSDSYKFYKDNNGEFRYRGDSTWAGIVLKDMKLDDYCALLNEGYVLQEVTSTPILSNNLSVRKYSIKSPDLLRYCDYPDYDGQEGRRKLKINGKRKESNRKKAFQRDYDIKDFRFLVDDDQYSFSDDMLDIDDDDDDDDDDDYYDYYSSDDEYDFFFL